MTSEKRLSGSSVAPSVDGDGLEDSDERIATQSSPQTFSFPHELRLKRPSDFAEVFKRGRVAADSSLVVHAIRGESEQTHIGLSVSKKVGNSPQRNRWKRLIREAFRLSQHDLPRGLMIVVRPRRGAQPDFREILASLAKLVSRLDRQL